MISGSCWLTCVGMLRANLSVDEGNKDDDGNRAEPLMGVGCEGRAPTFLADGCLMTTVCLTGVERSSRKKVEGDEPALCTVLGRGWHTAGLRSEILSENGTCARPSPPSCPARKARATRHPCPVGTPLATQNAPLGKYPLRPDSFGQPCPMPTRMDVTEANFARRECPSLPRQTESSSRPMDPARHVCSSCHQGEGPSSG